ncbi:MAG: hypothetical protein ACRDEB_02035, partial [Chitinophagaceae bacterium]
YPMYMGGLFKSTSLLVGNHTGYSVNFENVKITANSRSWFNNEMREMMKKFKPGNINTDMLKRISSKNVAAVIAMNYPPEGVKEFLKLFGVDGLINGLIGAIDLSIDDFVKAQKGDMLLVISDFLVKDKAMDFGDTENPDLSFSSPQPDAGILFALSINDKNSFDKIAKVVESEISKNEMPDDVSKIKSTVKDNWLIVGNSREIVEGFAAGNKTDHDFISKISGHPMGFYIDLQKIFGGIQTKDAVDFQKVLSGEGKIWDNIIAYGGEMKDDAMTSHFEINMIDKNTNSLKQFFHFLNFMAKTIKSVTENNGVHREYPALDSVIVNSEVQ